MLNYYSAFDVVGHLLIPEPALFSLESSFFQIQSIIPQDAIIVSEGANTMDIGRTMLLNAKPRHRLDAGTFGRYSQLDTLQSSPVAFPFLESLQVRWVLDLDSLSQLPSTVKIMNLESASFVSKATVRLVSAVWNSKQQLGTITPSIELVSTFVCSQLQSSHHIYYHQQWRYLRWRRCRLVSGHGSQGCLSQVGLSHRARTNLVFALSSLPPTSLMQANYERIAGAFGCQGYLARSLDELKQCTQAALSEKNQPSIINVFIDPSSGRVQQVRTPFRRAPFEHGRSILVGTRLAHSFETMNCHR